MKQTLLILLTLISLTSCTLDDEDGVNYAPVLVEINEATVPDEFTFGETYDITIKYTLPNGCYSFDDIYYDYQNTSRVIAVRALVVDSDVCTEIAQEGEYTFEVNCAQREDYIFKFWQGEDNEGNNQYLIVEVPVND